MAGLLGDVLPYIYQRANALKRGIGDFVSDPMGSIAQGVNYANDRAGGLLEATRAAADESAASGGLMYGPANQKLAGILANAYNPMGITVYHGSPHKFAKFDSSKIGTGEGAQAYGHGLYFAESPEVARNYREALSKTPVISYVNGGREIVPGAANYQAADIASMISRGGIDPTTKAGKEWIKSEIDARWMNGHNVARSDVMRLLKSGVEQKKELGAIYKVDLPDSAVARMLDWDKPLSQQPKEVREALTRIAQSDEAVMKAFRELGPNAPANQAYAALTQHAVRMKKYEGMRAGLPEEMAMPSLSYGQDAASRAIRQQGIPGIRYLDGGSRGAGTGTSNFVIFPGEESLLTILERNGMPLPK